jgi:hypothetical protein
MDQIIVNLQGQIQSLTYVMESAEKEMNDIDEKTGQIILLLKFILLFVMLHMFYLFMGASRHIYLLIKK